MSREGTLQIVESKQIEVRPPLPKELSSTHYDLPPQPKFRHGKRSESCTTFSDPRPPGQKDIFSSFFLLQREKEEQFTVAKYRSCRSQSALKGLLILIKIDVTHQMSNSAFLAVTFLLCPYEILNLD